MSLQEINGDLFKSEYLKEECVIAHCVSQDLCMGAGIAKEFRKLYGNVDFLKSQGKIMGEIAILEYTNNLHVIYLITKKKYYDKPTYASLQESINKLMEYYKTNNLSCPIIIPKIGCGLDRLEWTLVKDIIQNTLVNNGINVYAYIL